MDGMPGDTGEDIGEPGLGIDTVEPGGGDQAVHDRGTLATAIGAGEQPGLATKGDATQGPFRGMFDKQIRPLVRNRVKASQRLSK